MKVKKIKREEHTGIIIILAAVLLIISISFIISQQMKEKPKITLNETEEIKTLPDGTKYIVDPSKIISGGPPKGGIGVDRGIPALSSKNINFVSVSEANWISDNELVLALVYKGEKRVYPLQIMVWHEIVNDEIAGEPLLISYCPLCGSGIAYKRTLEINGKKQAAEFGTSGKLYNSDLVMYDSLTDTYWTQIEGKAIVGPLTGEKLEPVDIDTVVWREWKAEHPDSKVLSKDTGFNRQYGVDPYGNYYETSYLFFPVENEDVEQKIHPKTIIFGIEVNGKFKAYKEEDLIKLGKIEDKINGTTVIMERDKAGIVKVINKETGKEIIKERDFWFAWYAFHPETELYEV